MKTRTIPGPRGPFLIPAEPEATSRHAEACCRSVFEGEYSYPRAAPEDVRTVLDVGANLGAFSVWAMNWWPSVRTIWPYEPNYYAGMLALENIGNALQLEMAQLIQAAVTTRASAQTMTTDENWGARRIVLAADRPDGDLVQPIHPASLPAADVVKIDVEGDGADIAAYYSYWSDVRVLAYESHNADERDALARRATLEGMRMVRGNPLNPECDVRVWVRP